ncbi:esterase-like activity of phytase family protein [Erythrobacter sp. WG]|uniref:esterase-like activity of phytase family protein n=1 Tax=Erythrobacter sp. WG TaxID=2985510 RepID=UPI0022722D7A|nr:esterase-like activity of phytase family protein [Erythrobacter sp. WG]MCX9148346.1 esterase-like activity of phytase family protein [Erythrobacter sp. WG]
MWRLLFLAVVVVGLAPGTFLRTPIGTRADVAVVTVTPRADRTGVSGDLRLSGVWELTSPHGWFGGFSALVQGDGAALIAGTDRGFLLDLDLAGDAPRAVPGSFRFVGITGRGRTEFVDLESLTRDPATGTLWGGFEYENLIVRWRQDGTRTITAPPEIADWDLNSGPEAMTRLADGRFLLIEEGSHEGVRREHQTFLYPGDPARGGAPRPAHFAAPDWYSPVDATGLPDGRLLILLRRVRYAIPARFDTAIVIADPATIRPGAVWQGRIIQRLAGGIFADNFEGIAYVPSAADPAMGDIWLISDNNFSVFQRSLLVRFAWPGAQAARTDEKAPGGPDA